MSSGRCLRRRDRGRTAATAIVLSTLTGLFAPNAGEAAPAIAATSIVQGALGLPDEPEPQDLFGDG